MAPSLSEGGPFI